jgi:hypothetical protein
VSIDANAHRRDETPTVAAAVGAGYITTKG